MRMTARQMGMWLGVPLLLLAVHDVRPAAAVPWLGVYSQTLSPELREGLAYDGSGVLVTRVVPGSPAERAGLRKGDVLVRVDTRTVDSPEELARVVRSSRSGENVVLHIRRDGNRRTLSARLTDRSENEVFQAPESPEPPRRDPDREREYREPRSEFDHGFQFNFDPGEGMSFLRLGRGRLGVRVESLNDDLAGYFRTRDGRGVLVLEVIEDTPAERAGLKAGDVITRVEDRNVSSTDDLVRALESKEGKVELTVVRHGAARRLEAELEQPRALRLRGGDGILGWRDYGRGSPDRRTIVVPPGDADRELRRELRELRDELRDLRRDFERMKQN